MDEIEKYTRKMSTLKQIDRKITFFIVLLTLALLIGIIIFEVAVHKHDNHHEQNLKTETFIVDPEVQHNMKIRSVDIKNEFSENDGAKVPSRIPSKFLPKIVDGVWTNVEVSERLKYNISIFSAFFDNRKGKIIRIIAKTNVDNFESIKCRLWLSSQDRNILQVPYLVVSAKIQEYREGIFQIPTTIFILCALPDVLESIPESVSVINNALEFPKFSFKIHQNSKKKLTNRSNISTFSVCVKPIQNKFNNVLAVLEFIEMYKILGVSKITLYTQSVGSQVDCFLKTLKDDSLKIIPWNFEVPYDKGHKRFNGVFEALNDCLYRNMYLYDNVIFVDLNEFIIPQGNLSTLPNVAKSDPYWETYPGIIVEHTNFYPAWPNDLRAHDDLFPISNSLQVLSRTARTPETYQNSNFTNYILRPEQVFDVRTFMKYSQIHGNQIQVLNTSLALVYRYKKSKGHQKDKKEIIDLEYVFDRTAHKYKQDLIKKTNRIYDVIKSKCKLRNLKN